MNQAITAVLVALTIWLCANTAKTNNMADNCSENTKLISYLMDRMNVLEDKPAIEVPEVKPDTINE